MGHGDYREDIDHTGHPHGFDTSEPKSGFIALFGIGTVITLVVTVLAIQFYFDRYKEHQVYIQVLAPEGQQLKDLRAREDAHLHSYGYSDREKGLVRLPIERAIELLIEESAENRLKYPTSPAPVKTEEPQMAVAAPAPQAGVKQEGVKDGNTAAPSN
ncbi:MAG: hypothetical protein ACRD7E_03980 [Bryobacteraceae bacterium]